MILAPGTILQRMYLKERLRQHKPGKFIEVGVGDGSLSYLLCQHGWQGVGFDLNQQATEKAKQLTKKYIDNNQYQIKNENWLSCKINEPVDLVISSMVLEHLDTEDEIKYFDNCKAALKPTGKAMLFIPSSMKYWGIEDEIAGHYRRYTKNYLDILMQKIGWDITTISGLTFPLSNVLYPLSNFLVQRSEQKKMHLSMKERTELSGDRNVLFKTSYPKVLKCILNEFILYPFHVLQKFYSRHPDCQVTYLECKPKY